MSTIGIILLCIAAAVVFAVLLILSILKLRTRFFTPTEDKAAQQEALNRDIKAAGFAYNRKGDVFYSLMDCWQREMGYCQLYDEGSSLFNMVMHCEPVRFSYAGKRWMIELWKGQYGITTGAEVGIYNTDREDIRSERFTGPFYDCARDSERLPMSFVLRKNGRVLFKRNGLHWWLTGFRLGEFSSPDELTLDVRIRFPNRAMRDAFLGGLQELGYGGREYAVYGNTVTVHYTTPHNPQPLSHGSLQEAAVQEINEANCALYRQVTGKYTDTLDKLEYIKALVPELYEFFLHSLYGKAFYDSFRWLLDLIHAQRPAPKPVPPAPYPPGTCPSEPCAPDSCTPDSCGSPSPCRPRPDSCCLSCRPNRLCCGCCEECPYRRVSCGSRSSCQSYGSRQHMSLSYHCPDPPASEDCRTGRERRQADALSYRKAR
ncbi:MAG TPA: DUF4474 domain-containing protein [Candidatus Eisenbergiella merdipullorum]|uniref:DUF4474 domain-containing protein n=1 Tax=Candidatus Eisenbergiella merdipullorum TaxID=2838553 RepID=A0A9D2I4E2_9FIRM|nr:DUF4474 domain-containing protein [Candidatus Eisenbergiella merdipullorum]